MSLLSHLARPGFLFCLPSLFFVCLLPLGACASGETPTGNTLPKDSTKVSDTTWVEDSVVVYTQPSTLCIIDDARLDEISGIASSRLIDGVFWMHNDSGDEPRMFAVDSNGVTLAVCTFDGAQNVDYEDMASVIHDGTAWLYIGDVGDNSAGRASVTIHRLPEPEVQTGWRDRALTVAVESAVFRYPDGARDCEALIVDPRDGRIVLLDKSTTSCAMYAAAWPGDGEEAALEHLGSFRLPFDFAFWRLVTGADIHPGGQRVLLRTYNAVLEYVVPPGTPLRGLFDSAPAHIFSTPGLIQAEAVCYSRDGRDILTTSEGVRPPLLILRHAY